MRRVLAGITVTALTLAAQAAAPRLPAPPAAAPLPALAAPLVLDGALDEWTGAASVPLMSPQDLVRRAPVRPWPGPASFGAEVRLAWTSRGLCVAALVADSQAVGDSAAFRRAAYDMLEVILDARVPSALGTDPAGPGVCDVQVLAPVVTPPLVSLPQQQAVPPDIGAAGRIGKEKDFWTLEVMIPWPATFAPKPGSRLGLEVAVTDQDPADAGLNNPQALARRGVARSLRSPSLLARWELVDRIAFAPERSVGPMLDIDAPAVITDPAARIISVYLSGSLAAGAGSVRLVVRDDAGKGLYDKASRVAPLEMPWAGCAVARFPFDTRYGRDGLQEVEALALDDAGAVLGLSRISVTAESRRMERLLSRLNAAASGPQPGGDVRRTQECLAAAAAFERYRAATLRGDTAMAAAHAAETDARLAAFDRRAIVEPLKNTLYDLLRFSRPPDVVVEFEGPRTAYLSLYCGAVPLAGATVRLHESKVAAMASLRLGPDGNTLPARDTLVAKQVAAVTDSRVENNLAWDPAGFDPQRHLSTAWRNRFVTSFDTAGIGRAPGGGFANHTQVVILPGCPEGMSAWVKAWAARTKRAIVPLDSMGVDSIYVVAGDYRDSAAAARLTARAYTFASYVPDACRLAVCAGSRSYVSASPSPDVARRMVSLLLANVGITEEDVDGVRQMLVRALCPPGVRPAAPALDSLFCGDVHAHSSESDGTPSPEGLLLEALYANLDFATVSDHNTVLGALRAQTALQQKGVSLTVIAGEEVTTDSGHINILPLSARIPAAFPFDPVIASARAQNAFVQINHPAHPSSAWGRKILEHGLAGTGLDAWEHIPARYDEWAAAGTLPTLTGSTDTHNGLYGELERTVVLAIDHTEQRIVQALKENRCAIVNASSPRYYYGPESAARPFWAALAEGSALKRQKAAMLRDALKAADLPGLLAGAAAAR